MNLEERGIKAEILMNDSVFLEALEDIKNNYMDAARALPLHEKYHTERALNITAVNVVDAVTSHLRTAIEVGKEAAQKAAERDLTPKRIVRTF